MNTAAASLLDQFTETTDAKTATDLLIRHFRAERLPFELFEAMKMRTRISLGLAPVALDGEPRHDEQTEQAIEAGLLEACRAAGVMLLEDGRIREGWLYLRPLGDTTLAKQLLSKIAATDENNEDLVAVLLHEGVDVGRGFSLLLQHNGTCNSITTFEQVVSTKTKVQQREAAGLLLEHLYQELLENVRGDITRRDGKEPAAELSLTDLLTARRQLLEGGAYHVDTSHLAATVRFARVLTQPGQWQKALELTTYGRQLAQPLQYPGEEPFRDVYPTHATFFSVLLDRQRDAGITFFERKARSVDTEEHGTAAVETYVELLDRVGRTGDALKAAIEMVPENIPVGRVLPWLLDMAQRCGGHDQVLVHCKARGDMLGYVATMAAKAI